MFNPDFECLPLGGCSQQCNNVEGSYFCSCDDGYELQTDGFNCLGEFCLMFDKKLVQLIVQNLNSDWFNLIQI